MEHQAPATLSLLQEEAAVVVVLLLLAVAVVEVAEEEYPLVVLPLLEFLQWLPQQSCHVLVVLARMVWHGLVALTLLPCA